MKAVEHMADLKKLVDYQIQQGGVVLFQLRLEGSGDQDTFAIYGLNWARPGGEEDTLVVRPFDTGTFAAWHHAGYVRVVTAKLGTHASTFRLTTHGVKAVRGG